MFHIVYSNFTLPKNRITKIIANRLNKVKIDFNFPSFPSFVSRKLKSTKREHWLEICRLDLGPPCIHADACYEHETRTRIYIYIYIQRCRDKRMEWGLYFKNSVPRAVSSFLFSPPLSPLPRACRWLFEKYRGENSCVISGMSRSPCSAM